MMESQKHFTLSDNDFIAQFETFELPENWFTHEAHLRLAYILLKRHGVLQSIQKMCAQIKQFDHHFGDGTKYHHTITIAAIKTVNHFMLKSSSTNIRALLQEFPQLKSNFFGLLKCHYSPKILESNKSRVSYIEPDLLPYDS